MVDNLPLLTSGDCVACNASAKLRIGFPHYPPDLQLYEKVSRFACGDMLALIDWAWLCTARCRRSHQTLTFLRELAIFPDLPHAHVGVADDGRQFVIRISNTRISFCLDIPHCLHSCSNGIGWLPYSISTQLLIIYSWHFDVNINSVRKGTRDPLLIFGNDSRCTRIGFCVSEK
jgi:hypothetical protein